MAFPTATATNGPNDTGTATLNAPAGKVTTGDLTNLGGENYVLTINNTSVDAGDIVLASVANGTGQSWQGPPIVSRVEPGAHKVVIALWKSSMDNTIEGNVVVSFYVHKAP